MWAYELRDGFGFDHLVRTERPDPHPGFGEVVVSMRAASLNYRDLLVVKGLYNPKMPLPRIPLSDGAGVVTAVGPSVTRVKAGDRVAGTFMQTYLDGEPDDVKGRSALGGAIDGVLAESVVFHENGLVHFPDHLSDEEAATLPCAAVTAWNALFEGPRRVGPGDTVLVLGTGGVSTFALQFAVLAGARVIATSSSSQKLELVRSMGAAATINYRETSDWDRTVRELTLGTGVDHVVEVGGPGTLPLSLKAVRTGGVVSLIGVLSDPAGAVNPVPILMKSITVRGIYVGSRSMFERMSRAIEAHHLRPVIDRTFSVHDIVPALEHMESGAHFGKIVMSFQ